jgi:hypothetical protein
MERLLFVVAQDRADLYRYLTWHFSSEPGVQVILDRRRQERRQRMEGHDSDRRRGERRRRPRPGTDPLSLSQVATRRIEEEAMAAADRIPPGSSLRFRPFRARVGIS